jgi:hypothetical protein
MGRKREWEMYAADTMICAGTANHYVYDFHTTALIKSSYLKILKVPRLKN